MKISVLDRTRDSFFDCSSAAGRRLIRSLIGAFALAVCFTLLMAALGRDIALGEERMRPVLRATIAVPDAIVTIGDFFEGAGAQAATPLFRSPDLGTTGAVSARRVVDLARVAGLAEAETGGLVEVEVTRLSRRVEADDLGRIIAAEALRRNGRAMGDASLDDLRVTFDKAVDPRQADLRAAEPARLVSFSHTPQNGRFEALFQIDQGGSTERLLLRGELVETVRVVTLTRQLGRGDVVGRDDVVIDHLPRRVAGSLRAVDPEQFIGMAARRTLRPDQPLALGDFTRPTVVGRGDTVVIVYETTNLTVTSRAQALESGAVGDLVSVINPQSKRTLHATVAGPGKVVVDAASKTVAAIGRTTP